MALSPFATHKRIASIHRALMQQMETALTFNLAARGAGGRDQAGDNDVLVPANFEMTLGLTFGYFTHVLDVFESAWTTVMAFQAAHNCELHKGSIAFNAAVAHLRRNDFSAALHLLELAEHEDQETQQNPAARIWNHALLDEHFWDLVAASWTTWPLTAYASLWQRQCTIADLKATFTFLSSPRHLHFLVVIAQRTHYRRLASTADWPDSISLALNTNGLIVDLCVLLEDQLKARLNPPTGLLKYLLKDTLHQTNFGDVSTRVATLLGTYPISNVATFNQHYPALRLVVDNANQSEFERLCHALVILYGARNQVAHTLDPTLVTTSSQSEAWWAVDLLLALVEFVRRA